MFSQKSSFSLTNALLVIGSRGGNKSDAHQPTRCADTIEALKPTAKITKHNLFQQAYQVLRRVEIMRKSSAVAVDGSNAITPQRLTHKMLHRQSMRTPRKCCLNPTPCQQTWSDSPRRWYRRSDSAVCVRTATTWAPLELPEML